MTVRYPVFMNKNIKEELEDVKSELNYEKKQMKELLNQIKQ